MATTLEDLIASLSNQQSYTPLTSDQIKQTATNRYQSLYDQKRLDAEQQYKTNDTALAQQLAGLQQSYDKQRKSTDEEYQKAASQTDRYSLNRGMQRSSYNNATIANIGIKGAEAQDDINTAQRTAEGNIAEQRALLAQQLAQQKSQLNASQANDIMAYMDELEAREYERTQNDTNLRNQLAMQLYQYQFQKDQAAQEQENWQKQFDATYKKSSGGGSTTPRNTTDPANNNGNAGGLNYEALIEMLNGGNGGNNGGNQQTANVAWQPPTEISESGATELLRNRGYANNHNSTLGAIPGSGYVVRRN